MEACQIDLPKWVSNGKFLAHIVQVIEMTTITTGIIFIIHLYLEN